MTITRRQFNSFAAVALAAASTNLAAQAADEVVVAATLPLTGPFAAVAKDLAALANPDVSSPFASANDAVDRLLPYHVR